MADTTNKVNNNQDQVAQGGHGITEQEARDLGSAEFNAMTFTPPGGAPMTLDEIAAHNAALEAEKQRGLAVLRQANEDEERRRREMKDMNFEERVAYIAREDERSRQRNLEEGD